MRGLLLLLVSVFFDLFLIFLEAGVVLLGVVLLGVVVVVVVIMMWKGLEGGKAVKVNE